MSTDHTGTGVTWSANPNIGSTGHVSEMRVVSPLTRTIGSHLPAALDCPHCGGPMVLIERLTPLNFDRALHRSSTRYDPIF